MYSGDDVPAVTPAGLSGRAPGTAVDSPACTHARPPARLSARLLTKLTNRWPPPTARYPPPSSSFTCRGWMQQWPYVQCTPAGCHGPGQPHNPKFPRQRQPDNHPFLLVGRTDLHRTGKNRGS
eukprot:gene18112-biopygen15956